MSSPALSALVLLLAATASARAADAAVATAAVVDAGRSAVVQGSVVDSSGAVVPGVLIQVEQGLLRLEVTSDSKGRYLTRQLAPGTARISARLSGFQQFREEVTLAPGETRDVAIRLTPASLADSVTVVAEGSSYKPGSATTGTKLDLALLDTPQSVSVITTEVMEDRQVVRLAELADNVAGVRSSPGYGGLSSANYYMRGFRGSFTGGNLRDGFRDYTFLSSRDVQGIEQTEFLKGPASIVYGQQEVGGIVNTVLKKPQPWRFIRVGLTAGGYEMFRPTLDLNTPINAGNTVLFRLNAAYEKGNSHRDFVRNESAYIAPSLIWKASDATRLRLSVEYQKYDYLFDLGYAPEPEFFAQPVDYYYGEPGFNYTKTDQRGGTIELSHSFSGSWNFRSAFNALAAQGEPKLLNPGALRADRRTINRSALQSEERSRNYSLQNEVYGRFKTGGLQHNVVLGTELVRWNFRYVFYTGVGGAAPIDRLNPVYGAFPSTFTPLFADDTSADIGGLFVQDQIALRSDLKLLGGARLDRVNQRSDDPLSGQRVNSRSTTNVAPRAGLLFNPHRTTALYLSYTNSFLPQYGVGRTGERFDPQRGRQYEAGVKQNLLEDKLFATVALYRLWKTNVPTTDPVDPRFSIISGEQKSRGVEVELAGKLVPQWSVIANYAFTDASVSRDNRLVVGSKLVGVPRHSTGLWTTYDLDHGALSGMSLGVGVYRASERHARLPNIATLIPSYTRVDASIGYKARRFSIRANVKNLTNVKWYEAQGSNVFPQATRHVLVSVGYQFR